MDRLSATVQHYDWGDDVFLAQLQRRRESGRPEAELWMGAHRSAPALLESTGRSLAEAIAADPKGQLGERVQRRFGWLPFLAKILAAARPLSIQAHPSVDQAIEGFARENTKGIPVDAAHRIYRDQNHKPELICALTTFDAKCGFRRLDDTRDLFDRLDGSELDPVRSMLGQTGDDAEILGATLAWLLRRDGVGAQVLVDAAVQAAERAPDGGPFAADLTWTGEIARARPGDIGVVVALLLNHITLEPGQAVFLGAGNLHSYLRGAGVELMANSDNVVRGALTSKHVDVDELLDVVDCSPGDPQVQTAQGCIHTFDSPVPDFSLCRVTVDDDVRLRVDGPEVLIVTEGLIEFTTSGGNVVAAEPGVPIWVSASDECYLARGRGVFHRAVVPD